METYPFVPSVVIAGKFEGSVSVEFLDFDARWTATAELAELQARAADSKSTADNVALIRFMAKTALPCVKSVTLKRVSDSVVYSSIEQLARDPRCQSIVEEICTFVIAGTEPETPGNGG